MNCLKIVGLGLNLLGTIILIFPMLCIKEWLNDTEITECGGNEEDKPWATTKGRKKTRNISLWGLGLIALGFLFQIFSLT